MKKGGAALLGFLMEAMEVTPGGLVMALDSARGQEDAARGPIPIMSSQCMVVTVRILPSRPQPLSATREQRPCRPASHGGSPLSGQLEGDILEGTLQKEHCFQDVGVQE